MTAGTDVTESDSVYEPDSAVQDVDPALEKTDVFHILQNSRRRGVVKYFEAFEGPVSIGDLTDQVTAWECGVPRGEADKDERQRVYISLYQSHLYKLDAHDVVDYDAENGVVAPGVNHGLVASQLLTEPASESPAGGAEASDAETQASPSWPGIYLGISLGGILPVVAQVLHVLPAQVLSLKILNLVIVAAYVLVAATQYAVSR